MRSNPLAADTLAGYQFASVFHSRHERPEKKLFAAVLMNAIADLEEALASRKPQRNWRLQELVAWFFSHDRSWPLSFENLCEHLDVNAGCVRRRIGALLQQEQPTGARKENST